MVALFLVVLTDRMRSNNHKTQEDPSQYEKNLLYIEGSRAPGQAAPRGHGVSLSGYIQIPSGCIPVSPGLGDPVWAEGLHWLIPRGPFQLLFCEITGDLCEPGLSHKQGEVLHIVDFS